MTPPEHGRRAPALLSLLVAAAYLLACSPGSKNPDRGAAEIAVHALTVVAPSTVKLTVQSPSVMASPLRIQLAQKDQQFQATINNLPVASDYLFTAEALDQDGEALARGIATGVVISKGSTARIIIYLNSVQLQSPYTNSAPIIDTITLAATSVLPGADVGLSATAHDPDNGQTATLLFAWVPAAGCGAISDASTNPGTDSSHPSRSQATWTAPKGLGDCKISLAVKDVLGLSNSATFAITVASLDTGGTTVVAVFNGAPTIVGLTADPAQISADGATSGVLAVQAVDPEDDPLSYAWSSPAGSPCTVDFGTPGGASTPFTITATSSDATSCTFLVAVNDGFWPDTPFPRNTSTASLTLAITHALVVSLPPVFGVAYQSESTATGESLVTFAAAATDPAAGALTFDWSTSMGSPPNAADPKALNLDPAFVTASTWTVPAGAENATSALVVSVTATSSTTGLQSSFSYSLVPANLQ